jgi:uncharacterized protein YwgA
VLNYQVAKIIEWAGVLHSRKRAQKVAYLLNAAGAEFEAEFRLHQYGPYSEDIAGAIDDLVRRRFVIEQSREVRGDTHYSYLLSEMGRAAVTTAEAGAAAQQRAEFRLFEVMAKKLLPNDVLQLETAATIAFFAQDADDWTIAIGRACRYRGVDPGTPSFKAAAVIARHVIAMNPKLRKLATAASPV